jgi:hypothetical protein
MLKSIKRPFNVVLRELFSLKHKSQQLLSHCLARSSLEVRLRAGKILNIFLPETLGGMMEQNLKR